MKLHNRTLEIPVFSIILLFCAIPPLFYSINPAETVVFEWKFPLSQTVLALSLFAVYLVFHESEKINNLKLLIYTFLTFISLLALAFIISRIQNLKTFSSFDEFNSVDVVAARPESICGWIFCILSFFFAAFYEEALYRFYLPEQLTSFASFIKREGFRKCAICLFEIITLLLFAAAHLYLGFYSFGNAVFAHIVLRLCFKKSKSIIPGFAAHFAYNVISLILL